MKTFIRIQIALAMVFSIIVAAQEQHLEAKIDAQDFEGKLHLKALVNNPTPIHYSLNYLFLVVKGDEDNNISSSQQANKFTLKPNESKKLSESTINFEKNHGLKVFLFVREEKTNQILAKDSLVVNPDILQKKSLNALQKIDEEEIILKGLTIDETRTKAGRDFYDKLHQYMMLNSIEFEFTVKVTEIPTNRNSTQIFVNANDTNVFTFLSKPDDEYLKLAVDESVSKLNNFAKQNKVKDEGFMY